MIFVRSLLFVTVFLAWTAFIVVPFCFLWICPRRWLIKHLRIWALGVMRLLKDIAGIRYEVIDRHFLPAGPAFLVGNHESVWETIIFHILSADPCYIMKRVLFWIPFYGQHAWKVGMIGISRDKKNGVKSLKHLLRKVPERLARGGTVIIFPQGTRTEPRKYAPFNVGAYAIYRRINGDSHLAHCPIVPFALNSGLFWNRRIFEKRPGVIKIRFLPPIPQGLNREQFMTALEKIRVVQCELEKQQSDL